MECEGAASTDRCVKGLKELKGQEGVSDLHWSRGGVVSCFKVKVPCLHRHDAVSRTPVPEQHDPTSSGSFSCSWGTSSAAGIWVQIWISKARFLQSECSTWWSVEWMIGSGFITPLHFGQFFFSWWLIRFGERAASSSVVEVLSLEGGLWRVGVSEYCHTASVWLHTALISETSVHSVMAGSMFIVLFVAPRP